MAAIATATGEMSDKCASVSSAVCGPSCRTALLHQWPTDVLHNPCRLCFIEAVIDRDDCSSELLEWGSRVAAANARPANPQ